MGTFVWAAVVFNPGIAYLITGLVLLAIFAIAAFIHFAEN